MSGRAPGPLQLVQDFINTLYVEKGDDALAHPAQLRDWLTERDLLEAGDVTDRDLVRAKELREALRSLAEANLDGAPGSDGFEVLNEMSDRAAFSVRFTEGRANFEPTATGVAGALGRLLSIVVEAMAHGTWVRLKACRRDSCRWAFYDRSRNRSGAWCAMKVCGNREKAKSYRRRHMHPVDGA